MVRLEAETKRLVKDLQQNFNSTMVRLEEDLVGQAIKRTSTISIPLWYD